MDGVIEALAKRKNISPADLHINQNGSACLCLNLEETKYLPNGFNLPDFFNYLVVPFFYAQSYFRDFGLWPWGEYGHGLAGILESYLNYDTSKEYTETFIVAFEKFCQKNNLNLNFYKEQLRMKKIKGKNKCPLCKSGKQWLKCHEKSLLGFRRLKKHMDILGIKL